MKNNNYAHLLILGPMALLLLTGADCNNNDGGLSIDDDDSADVLPDDDDTTDDACELTSDPESLDFGEVEIGGTAVLSTELELVCDSGGSVQLSVVGINDTPFGYVEGPQSFEMNSGETVSHSWEFAPEELGSVTETVSFTLTVDGVDPTTLQVAFTGIGTEVTGDDDDATGDDDDAVDPVEDCLEPGDEDGDGFFDCDDADCADDPACDGGDDDDSADPQPSTFNLAGAAFSSFLPSGPWAGGDHDDLNIGWGNSLGISLWTNGSSVTSQQCQDALNAYQAAITDTGDGIDLHWVDDLGNVHNTFTVVNFPAPWANLPTGNCAFQVHP